MNSYEFNFIGTNKPLWNGLQPKEEKWIEDDGDMERKRKGLREEWKENRKGKARDGEKEKIGMTKENMDKERRIDEGLGEGEKKSRRVEGERRC